MWVQSLEHQGQQETLSELHGEHNREEELTKLRSRCGASWDTPGKGSLREGRGEGMGNKVEVGGVHTARLLWIFDEIKICALGLSLTIWGGCSPHAASGVASMKSPWIVPGDSASWKPGDPLSGGCSQEQRCGRSWKCKRLVG